MVICKKKIINIILVASIIFIIKPAYSEVNFESFETKKVSYIDFFLLKFEISLIRRSKILRKQLFDTRVQYSNIGVEVDLDKKREEISVNIYAMMDKTRYGKKKYTQKLSDCNQVRNLIFYNKHGYKFFSQKRDPALSEGIMFERRMFYSTFSLEDQKEGMAAFIEKRNPTFRHR